MHHQIAFGQNALGIGQHFAHQIGAIDDDGGPARIAKRPDRHAISLGRQKREQITIAADHAAHQGDHRGQGLWPRRGKGAEGQRVIHGALPCTKAGRPKGKTRCNS